MKLLGGISSQQPSNEPPEVNAAEASQSPPVREDKRHNVMAEVIERHERIANRAKRTR